MSIIIHYRRWCNANFIFVSSFAPPFYPVGTGEDLRLAKERISKKNVYFTNPSFDR